MPVHANRSVILSLAAALLVGWLSGCHSVPANCATLRAGAAAVTITPFGQNGDWEGPITASGVWGEQFVDTNHNGRWDAGEAFSDEERNTAIDAHSRG